MEAAERNKKYHSYKRIQFELSRAFYTLKSGQLIAVLLLQAAAFLFAWSKGAGALYRDMIGPVILITLSLWIYTGMVHGNRRILVCCLLLLTVGTMLQSIFLAEKGAGTPVSGLSRSLAGELQVQYMAGLGAALLAGFFYFHCKKIVSVEVCRLLLALSLILSLTALLHSAAVGGARNWIHIGFLSIQTTELVKPTYLLTAAALLGTGQKPSGNQIFSFGLTTLILTGVMILQGEFGTFLLILLVFFCLMVLFVPEKKYILLTALVLGALILLALAAGLSLSALEAGGKAGGLFPPARAFLSAFNKIRNRFVYWLHPERDPQGLGYQLLRAREAIFLGGWFGTSSLTKLPVETSDLVYPALIERCGLIFALLVFVLYISLWLEGIRVSVRKQDRVHKVIAAGSAFFLFDQTLIIIAGSTGLCPLTGITLPFISSGGTSLVISFVLAAWLITASGNISWKGEDIEEKELFAQSTIGPKLHSGLRHIYAHFPGKDIGHPARPVKGRRYEKEPGQGKSLEKGIPSGKCSRPSR